MQSESSHRRLRRWGNGSVRGLKKGNSCYYVSSFNYYNVALNLLIPPDLAQLFMVPCHRDLPAIQLQGARCMWLQVKRRNVLMKKAKKLLFLKPNELCLRNRQDYVVCLPSQLLRVIWSNKAMHSTHYRILKQAWTLSACFPFYIVGE